VELTDISEGAKLGKTTKTIVTIVNDDGNSAISKRSKMPYTQSIVFKSLHLCHTVPTSLYPEE